MKLFTPYYRLLVYVILALQVSSLVCMDENEWKIKDDNKITIQSSDGQEFKLAYKLAKQSKTLDNLIQDTIRSPENLSSPIPVPNVTKAIWDQLIVLLDLELKINFHLTKKDELTKQASKEQNKTQKSKFHTD